MVALKPPYKIIVEMTRRNGSLKTHHIKVSLKWQGEMAAFKPPCKIMVEIACGNDGFKTNNLYCM